MKCSICGTTVKVKTYRTGGDYDIAPTWAKFCPKCWNRKVIRSWIFVAIFITFVSVFMAFALTGGTNVN